MDSPPPLDDVLAADAAEASEPIRRSPARAARGTANAPDIRARRREVWRVRRAARSRAAWTGAALAAAAGVALIAYAGMRPPERAGASITSKIPDSATAGAAVQNLPPPNLLKPLTPEEAVKENSERPFVERPDSPASRFVLKADAADRERALTCLTQAVYYEAASEGADGGRAVAQVVLNRMRHPGYPATICGVVYEGSDRGTGCQFTFTCDGALLRPHVPALWTRSQKIAEQALDGHVFAPVGHATHYHADYVLPYWADSLDKTVQIGRHIFYRLRGSVGDSRSFFQRYAGFEPPLPQPSAALVAAPAPDPEVQQLASALIGEDSKGTPQDAEKIGIAATPLLADAATSRLIADGDAPPVASHRAKVLSDCQPSGDRKKLVPLTATDMRAGLSSLTC